MLHKRALFSLFRNRFKRDVAYQARSPFVQTSAQLLDGTNIFLVTITFLFLSRKSTFSSSLGTMISECVKLELKPHINLLKLRGVYPHLAVVLVGDRKDSAAYVRMKKKACLECDIKSTEFHFDNEITQEELIEKGNCN